MGIDGEDEEVKVHIGGKFLLQYAMCESDTSLHCNKNFHVNAIHLLVRKDTPFSII